MSDFLNLRPHYESYPPSLWGGGPPAYVPPTPANATDLGVWAAQAGPPAGDGELQISGTTIAIHGTNNGGVDHTADLSALVSGDKVWIIGQDGHLEAILTADATETGGVVTLTATTVGTGGAQLTASDAVNVWTEPTVPPPPPLPGPVPDDTWTKAEIVAWLNDHGDPAQASLTKDELLAHVQDILD